jgi:hypothetical protein
MPIARFRTHTMSSRISTMCCRSARPRNLRGLVLPVPEDHRLSMVFRVSRKAPFLADLHRRQSCFFPQHFLGLAGMPRRVADYRLCRWSYVSSDREQRGVSACPRGTASKPRGVPSFSSLTICLHGPGEPRSKRHLAKPRRRSTPVSSVAGFWSAPSGGRGRQFRIVELLFVSQNCWKTVRSA